MCCALLLLVFVAVFAAVFAVVLVVVLVVVFVVVFVVRAITYQLLSKCLFGIVDYCISVNVVAVCRIY